MKITQFILALVVFPTIAISQNKPENKADFIRQNIEFAEAQTKLMLKTVGMPTGKNYPRTTYTDSLRVTNMYEWTSGFFPGTLWYLYELTNDTTWKNAAEQWTVSLEPLKTYKGTHDLGFMMYCSYGNAERLAPKAEYNEVLLESANSLISRFNHTTQSIKSWNGGRAWDGTTRWTFPVIIDNMMNLEMLFYVSKLTGDKKYYNIAETHANTTIKNHFREDFSTYHVVDYDTTTGDVQHQVTAQGYSNNSTWARGQAWAIYGFTVAFRETKNLLYLDAATKAASWYLRHLPEDFVPLWDFNVGQEGYTPDEKSYAVTYKEKHRDASAAAIVCSALFELAELTNNPAYLDSAIKMLNSLASSAYRAQLGQNADFILMHSVGSIPHKTEIDKALVYADYYFLEALLRYQKSVAN
ncbi:MAG: glycoside hydrolase family 88 protein [Bacteroidales bacterium]|jgi:rhamnogalacturonyl hydrolase YesR|nr:glycoside hydrolase family 88 protein [Bacteroidales bacterium]